MYIPMYQLAWHLVMEDLTPLQHLYENLRSYKRNFLVLEFQKFLMYCVRLHIAVQGHEGTQTFYVQLYNA